MASGSAKNAWAVPVYALIVRGMVAIPKSVDAAVTYKFGLRVRDDQFIYLMQAEEGESQSDRRGVSASIRS